MGKKNQLAEPLDEAWDMDDFLESFIEHVAHTRALSSHPWEVKSGDYTTAKQGEQIGLTATEVHAHAADRSGSAWLNDAAIARRQEERVKVNAEIETQHRKAEIQRREAQARSAVIEREASIIMKATFKCGSCSGPVEILRIAGGYDLRCWKCWTQIWKPHATLTEWVERGKKG
jgi:hypothetical protein